MDKFKDLNMKLNTVVKKKQAEYENQFIKNDNNTAGKTLIITYSRKKSPGDHFKKIIQGHLIHMKKETEEQEFKMYSQ